MNKKVFIALIVKYERVLYLIFKIDVCYQIKFFHSCQLCNLRLECDFIYLFFCLFLFINYNRSHTSESDMNQTEQSVGD
jgi:hypothetical protein